MRLAYLPLLAGAGVPPLGRWLASRAHPRFGVWILAALSLLLAVTTIWAYALLAVTLLEDVDGAVGGTGDPEPVFDAEAWLGLLAIAVAAVRLVRTERAHRRMHRDLRLACAEPGHGELVVLAEAEPYAFALPGPPHRVVVTQGLLRVLTAAQRRVLLAHERAHLTFAHHWFQSLVRIASIVNPLLLPLRAHVGYLCERWADEHAAICVGDRGLTAEALAAAALAKVDARRRGVRAFSDLGVRQRIAALIRPRTGPVPVAALGAVALVAVCVTADADATRVLLQFLSGSLH